MYKYAKIVWFIQIEYVMMKSYKKGAKDGIFILLRFSRL